MNASSALRMGSTGLLLLTATVLPTTAQQTRELPRTDRALRGAPTPVFQVGADEGEEWELLVGVRAVAFDDSDTMYVLDAGNFRVLAFDSAGRFLRQIGRRGDGPGELAAPTSLAVTGDGMVVVADIARRGYAVFTPEGEFVRTVTAPANRGFIVAGAGQTALQADPEGWLIARSMPRLDTGNGAPVHRGGSPVYRQPMADDASTITLHEFPVPQPRTQDVRGEGGRVGRVAVISQPAFSPPTLWAALPGGGVAVVDDDEYVIRLIDGNGSVVAVVRRPLTPRRVSARDQEQARARLREQMASGQAGVRVTNVNGQVSVGTGTDRGTPAAVRALLEQRLESMEFAATVPVITGLLTDPAGRIWVQRESGDLFRAGPIDLVTSGGAYIGTVANQPLPAAVSRSGLAAYIERDDLGIERVVVRRLPSAWRTERP